MRKVENVKKIRFGVIGCGNIFQSHLQAIIDIPETELVAVFIRGGTERLMTSRR